MNKISTVGKKRCKEMNGNDVFDQSCLNRKRSCKNDDWHVLKHVPVHTCTLTHTHKRNKIQKENGGGGYNVWPTRAQGNSSGSVSVQK